MPSSQRVTVWIGRLLDAALLLLIAVSLLTVVLGRVVPVTGRSTFVVAGGSMVPALSVGSAVVVDPVAPGELVVGDVVSLRSGPEHAVFTHRIVRIADKDGAIWLETKGDANAAVDPSLSPASAVIGRVTVAIPKIGYVIALMSTVSGVVFVIALGLMLLLAGWAARGAGAAADGRGRCGGSRASRRAARDADRAGRTGRRRSARQPTGDARTVKAGSQDPGAAPELIPDLGRVPPSVQSR